VLYRLVNPYVQPVLHIRRPGSDLEETYRFPDDDPFFSEISVFIDNIEDIEESPEAATMLSSYEGMVPMPSNISDPINTTPYRCVQDVRAHLGHPSRQREVEKDPPTARARVNFYGFKIDAYFLESMSHKKSPNTLLYIRVIFSRPASSRIVCPR
jgi:hypothetical protein